MNNEQVARRQRLYYALEAARRARNITRTNLKNARMSDKAAAQADYDAALADLAAAERAYKESR